MQRFTNLKSNEINENFTPGQVASIKGSLLKFDAEDEQQGIFFLANDGTEIRVTNVVKNKPSELLFFVPDALSTGSYQVEVRLVFHNSKVLKKGKLTNELVSSS